MKSSPRIPLAAMMFLEYAVWGAWMPILGATLTTRLHASGTPGLGSDSHPHPGLQSCAALPE
jgi:hypothetical protein